MVNGQFLPCKIKIPNMIFKNNRIVGQMWVRCENFAGAGPTSLCFTGHIRSVRRYWERLNYIWFTVLHSIVIMDGMFPWLLSSQMMCLVLQQCPNPKVIAKHWSLLMVCAVYCSQVKYYLHTFLIHQVSFTWMEVTHYTQPFNYYKVSQDFRSL